jgi:hypothetical protein
VRRDPRDDWGGEVQSPKVRWWWIAVGWGGCKSMGGEHSDTTTTTQKHPRPNGADKRYAYVVVAVVVVVRAGRPDRCPCRALGRRAWAPAPAQRKRSGGGDCRGGSRCSLHGRPSTRHRNCGLSRDWAHGVPDQGTPPPLPWRSPPLPFASSLSRQTTCRAVPCRAVPGRVAAAAVY